MLVPAFMYAQRIGPQLKFIKITLLERTGVGRLLQIDCDDIYSKIGFESADPCKSSRCLLCL